MSRKEGDDVRLLVADRQDLVTIQPAATYDADGNRIKTREGCWGPSTEQLQAWDSEAPAMASRLVSQAQAIIDRRATQVAADEQDRNLGVFRAKYRGTCATTGRWFRAGDRIFRTSFGGYAIADDKGVNAYQYESHRDAGWLSRAMDHADSIY